MVSATKFISKYVFNDIISYVPTIDIRRHFNIYNKLNLNKYPKINTVLRHKQIINGSFTRYECCDNVDKKEYTENMEHLNDFVDVFYKNNVDGSISIEIQIWKLKYKNENNKSVCKNDKVYYAGQFENDYCWDDTVIKYNIN